MADPALMPALDKLDRLRRRTRRWYLLSGLSILALAFCGWAVLTYLLDRYIPDHLPGPVRLLFTAAGVAAGAILAWRSVVYPMSAALSDEDLALVLEDVFPDLRDRLISALQLTRRPESHPDSSPTLVAVLVRETAEAVAPFDFESALRPRAVRRRAALAGGAAALFAVLAAGHAGLTGVWLNRMLGGSAKWPQETYLTLTASAPIKEDKILIARGDALGLTVDGSRGRIPSSVLVDYRFDAGEHDEVRMNRTGASEFRYEFPQVNGPFRFQVRGGDDQTAWIEVGVETPPAVESVALFYDFPDYTGLPDTPPDRPETDGNIRAPVGTKVAFAARANTPLARAEIAVGREGREKVSPLRVEAAAASSSGAEAPAGGSAGAGIARGELEVTETTEYQIRLIGANGLAGRNPASYAVRAVVDVPPLVKVLEPAGDRRATKTAVYPLRLSVTDDFGIRAIRLVHKVRTRADDAEKIVVFGPAHNSAPYGRTKIDGACTFDLGALGVKEGDVVEYRFEAEDFKAPDPKNVTVTKTFLFTIVPEATLREEKESELNRIKEELRAVREAEDRLRGRIAGAAEKYAAAAALERPQRAEISGAASDQARLGGRTEHAARRLEAVVRDAGYNHLLDRESEQKLDRVRKILDVLAGSASPQGAQALSEASTTAAAEVRAAALGRAGERAREIVDGLDEALRLLEEYATYQEVIKLLQNHRKLQEEILKDLRDSKKGK